MQELRSAFRRFRQRPGLTAAVVLTLALGIGANSAIFSAVDAILLKPLPYPDADRLVSVYELNRGQPQGTATQLVAPGRLEEWHAQNRSFAGLAGCYFENLTDTTGALPERVEAMRTSPRFFSVLGVPAAIGRTFTADEERFGGPSSLVLSDAAWRTRFNGDPSVIGRTLVLAGAVRTVVGVMPASFRYPTATTEMWVPAQIPEVLRQARQARFYTAIGRLKPGVTIGEAEADLGAVQSRLGELYPQTDKGWAASIESLKEEQVGGVRRSLWLLFGAVALVLLTACANIACLLLADSARREHEVAVRFALGASRWIVIRQLLVEGLALGLVGSAAGLMLADWSMALLRQSAERLPRIQEVHVDLRLVAFTLALGLATTVAFALVPALGATRRDPADALSRGGRSAVGGRQTFRRALVTTQVTFAIVLLVGSGLLVRSFERLQQTSLGLDPHSVTTFRMSASWSERTDAVVTRQARTINRLIEIPGVEAAAFSQQAPAGIALPPAEFQIVGRDASEKTFAAVRAVSGGYFRTLRIPILQGDTCSNDPAEPPFSKVLVTRGFADRYFPAGDPIGHSIRSPTLPPGTSAHIIGVVGDVRENGVVHAPEPMIYWCGFQPYWPDQFFIVRADAARPASMAAIRAALQEIEPRRAVYNVRALSDLLSASVSQQRLSTVLLGLLALTALLLAGVGLYGVLAQLVLARRREIGVRMALGARPGHIVQSVLAEAAAMTGMGVAAGWAGALVLARVMTSLVFGVSTRDPMTFAAAPFVLCLVAAVAASLPARRAAGVDPMEALREQ